MAIYFLIKNGPMMDFRILAIRIPLQIEEKKWFTNEKYRKPNNTRYRTEITVTFRLIFSILIALAVLL